MLSLGSWTNPSTASSCCLTQSAWWEFGGARWLATPIACRASSWRWAPPLCVKSKLCRGHCGKQISKIFYIIRFYNWEHQTQQNACTVFVLEVLSRNFRWPFLPFLHHGSGSGSSKWPWMSRPSGSLTLSNGHSVDEESNCSDKILWIDFWSVKVLIAL